jgi:polysaccharide biosynthesis protein PslH
MVSAYEDSMDNYSGYSTRTINVAKGLKANGNDVSVILPKLYSGFRFVEGIPVYEVKGLCPASLLRLVGKIAKIAKPSALYFFDPLFMFRVSRLTKKVDFLQIELPALGLLLSSFIHKTIKKPVIMDCHDVFNAMRLKHTSLLRRIAETFLEKTALKNGDFLVTVSDREKQILGSMNFSLRKIAVAPNGVDTKSFSKPFNVQHIKNKYGLNGNRVVVFVGNLGYVPNQQALLIISKTIAPQVKQEVKDAKFLVVGKIRAEMTLPNVTFTGYVDNVAELLAVSDVGIAPLLEGSGTRLKILEYLSSGLPVVSTSVGAEGILAKNGTNILLEDKIEKFPSHIIALLKDSELCSDMGEAAKELAENYDWKKITKDLNGKYVLFLQNYYANLRTGANNGSFKKVSA